MGTTSEELKRLYSNLGGDDKDTAKTQSPVEVLKKIYEYLGGENPNAKNVQQTGDILNKFNEMDIKLCVDERFYPPIIDEVKGNPVTFSGSEAPLVRCDVDLKPQQDLHGYSKPWVGGAGKNKCNYNDSSTFNVYNGNVSITDYVISLVATGDDAYIGTYNYSDPTNAFALSQCVAGETYKLILSDNRFNKNYVTFFDSNNAIVSAQKVNLDSFTAPSGASKMSFRIGYEDTVSGTTYSFTVMVVKATETDSTFAPYSNICPISGYSSVGVNVVGKNLFDKDATPYQSGKYIASTSVVGSEPTYTSGESYNVYAVKVEPLTTYTYGLIKANSPCAALVDKNGIITSGVIWNDGGNYGIYHTVTTGANDAYLLLSVAISGSYKCDDILQVEKNSTHTDYEPYAGRTYTISLGDTYYSGQIDAVKGVLVADKAKYVYDGSNDEPWYASSMFIGSMYIPSNDMTFKKLQSPFITNQAEYIERDGAYSFGKCKNDSNASSYSFSVWLINTASVSDFRTYLAQNPLECLFELSTPIEIPLTPTEIFALQGINTMWTNADSLDVEYITDNWNIFHPTIETKSTKRKSTRNLVLRVPIEDIEPTEEEVEVKEDIPEPTKEEPIVKEEKKDIPVKKSIEEELIKEDTTVEEVVTDEQPSVRLS